MPSVVFLRAVNVGGANRCQPAQIAKQLAKFDVVNIGAVGTFVVREDVSESVLRNAFAKKLPFKCEIMICPGRDIIDLASMEPFSQQPSSADITRFVNVLARRVHEPPPGPHRRRHIAAGGRCGRTRDGSIPALRARRFSKDRA